jgi:hypothetical protein
MWDRGHLVVIMEVDEEQHAGRPCECEQARMINVSSDLSAPRTLWVRFNPDGYACRGKPVSRPARLATLRRVLRHAIEATPEATAAWPAVGVMQLFFDGHIPEREAQVQSLDHFLV